MCGIAGFSGNFDLEFLKKANQVQAHRGPDDQGTFFDRSKSIGLAHRRLSIIDLSESAKQPMFSKDRQTVIVFNGEIYNYRELKKQLENQGFSFRTSSDTEVLLYLYEVHGNEMFTLINGIFAFAIWDNKKKELFLARDGLGIKPLYYTFTPKGFLFASEIKALLKEPSTKKEISPQALHYHLSYLWCPYPQTILKNVFKLEPGHALIIRQGKLQKQWKFYDPRFGPYTKTSEKELSQNLARTIQKCVTRQMVSDVPVGAFLSGGLDSSSICHFAKDLIPDKKLECFTIGFENSNGYFDGFVEDLPYAKKVSQHLGLPLHTVTVSSEKMVSRIQDMIYHLDEPLADPAPLNVLFISELAKSRGIKVLLSGTGGDDLLSGYRRHTALMTERYWSWLPSALRKHLRVQSQKAAQKHVWGRRLARAFRFADQTPDERLTGYFLWMDPVIQNKLYGKDFYPLIRNYSTMEPLLKTLEQVKDEPDALNRMLYLEIRHFLADHNLIYTDKMGMAANIEIRVPLLDLELVDFASKIPPSLKWKNGTTKYLFKKAMEPHLPKEIIYRPKSGFGVPLRKWIHHELKDVLQDLLSESSIKKRGIFDPQAVKKLIHDDFTGKLDSSYTIFSLMCLEWWQRIFLDETR